MKVFRNLAWALAGSCALLLLGGCSGTIPVNYTPHNIVRYHGSINMGKFTYAPADSGKVKPNQVQNTAAGSIYLPTNIGDLVQRATALELEKTGFQLGASPDLVLSGNVLEFKAADLGYSVNWSYSVDYVITNSTSGRKLLDKTYAADPVKTGKFGQASDYSSSINELILSAYDKFIQDPQVRQILTGQSAAGVKGSQSGG